MSAFEEAFALTVGEEGGFGRDPRDRGNWTSGKVGEGELRGTKFGISAAAYPRLDIAALTLDDARAIYRRDYWTAIRGDELPRPIALAVFDAAVNSGPGAAARLLQAAVGAAEDGAIGPATLARVRAMAPLALLDDFHARRLGFMGQAAGWATYARGWAGRVLRLHRRLAAMMEGGA